VLIIQIESWVRGAAVQTIPAGAEDDAPVASARAPHTTGLARISKDSSQVFVSGVIMVVRVAVDGP
jgi:hypothetical protein